MMLTNRFKDVTGTLADLMRYPMERMLDVSVAGPSPVKQAVSKKPAKKAKKAVAKKAAKPAKKPAKKKARS